MDPGVMSNSNDNQMENTQSKTLLGSNKQRTMNMEQSHANLDANSKSQASQMLNHDPSGLVTAVSATQAEANNQPKKKKSKPAYLQSLNESEKQANFKIIEKMNKKISFLKNPRFKVNKSPIIMTEAMKNKAALEAQSIKISSFRVEPPTLNFQDYQVNSIYEIPIKITNVSAISKRLKFIPPETENFTIKYFKYPSEVTGDIAPGMSLNMSICFSAPSFADFDDCITFVTEESSFKIPMRARRDPPQISLSNPLDCLNSWLGDRVDMAFRCLNTGGDGGFKFFCEKDEDDSKQTDADSIKIGSFTLNPSEFYLYSGSAIDVYVSFNPEKEGKLEENLILACDNQTSEFYKLTGYGAMIDLDIIAVDGKEVNFKENPFETVYFDNTNPTSETKRIIRVKNSSPIMVPFHWSIYKQKNSAKITLEDEDTHYRVSPAQGKIPGGQYIDFELYFCPQHAEPYYEYADLIIEDIPISSVRDPPENLKSFAQANTSKNAKVPMPTYVGSNTQFLSIPMLQFNLRGQGNSCKVEVEPSFSKFEGDTYINNKYTQSVMLKKGSEGKVKYELRLEGKNRDSFDIDIETQGKTLSGSDGGIIKGFIEADEEQIELKIQVQSHERGESMAYFFIEIEDGAPVSFQVVANFMGPIVSCSNPVVDFGLVKVNSSQTFEITLQNQSPINAEVIIKKSNNQKLNFSNMMTIEQAMQMGPDFNSSLAPLVFNKPFKTGKNNQIKLNNYGMQLKPFEKQIIQIVLVSQQDEELSEYFEVMVQDGQSQFFHLKSDVQSPKVALNRVIMNLGRIYAGVTEYVNPQSKHQKASLVLKNYGNLPATFRWENINDPDRVVVHFEPHAGTIQPRQEVKIKMTVTVYRGGNLNELFLCDVRDMELPLGFEMLADSYGLNVSYETQEDQTAAMNTSHSTMKTKRSDPNSAISNVLTKLNFPHCTINKTSSQKFILKNLSGIKTSFDFDVQYYQPTHKVAPKEKSELEKAKEEAEKRAVQRQEDQAAGKSKKKVGFATTTNNMNNSMGSDNFQMRTRPILSDEHEQTQKFSSAVGETFTKTKQLEKDMSFYLSNNKGIAVVFTPHCGDLPPNSEIPVTVTVYNNVCGKFDDTIVSKVKGLGDVEFPVSISITGSPVRVPPNQVGINYNTIPPTLPMPTVVAKTKSIVKTFLIKNTGIKSVQIDWKIFDQVVADKPAHLQDKPDQAEKDPKVSILENHDQMSFEDEDCEEDDIFDLDIIKNLAFDKNEVPFKFEYTAIEPEVSDNSAFSITPASVMVGSRSNYTFTVTFDPSKGTGNFRSIILASPELSAEEIEIQAQGGGGGTDFSKKGSLGIISLNLDANTIDPLLSIDRKHKMDGQNHMRLKYWSQQSEDAPAKIQKLTFTNTSKADLTFNLSITGPFEIVKTKTNSGAVHPLAAQNQIQSAADTMKSTQSSKSRVLKPKAETMFCLQPLKIVEVCVKFLAPPSSDKEAWPMTIRNERSGELLAYFSNGDQQHLYLDGVLMRPRLQVLTDFLSKNDYAMDELDFGRVNVERERKIHVYLSNMTDVTAKWQLNYVKFPKKATIGHNTTTPWELENMEKTDDAEVFEFSDTNGLLKGTSLPLRKVPEGLLVPPVPKDEEEQKYMPSKIYIKFKPKANVLYKSKFRFICENGISCDVILKGRGSYEENYD